MMHANTRSSDGNYKALTCGSITLPSIRGVSNLGGTGLLAGGVSLGTSRYITTSLLLGIVARDEGKVEMSLTAAQ